MTTKSHADFDSTVVTEPLRCGSSTRLASHSIPRTRAVILSLRIQQSPPLQEDVCQGSAHLEPVQVLRQSSIAHLLEAKHMLDHADGMFDFGTHPRLRPVLCLVDLIDPAAASMLAIGEVPSSRCSGMDHFSLSLIAPITPNSRLAPMQQMRQCIPVSDVGRRGQDRMDQLRLAIYP